MAELARAYVLVLPDTTKFKAGIDSQVAGISNVVIPARFDINNTALADAIKDKTVKINADITSVTSAASKVEDSFEKAAKDSGKAIETEVAKGAEAAGGSISKLGGLLKSSLAVGGGLLLVSALASVKTGLRSAVSGASDLNEQLQRTQVVFGTAASTVTDFAKTTASAFGISRSEALKAAGTFGLFFDQVGLTTAQTAKMSTTFVGLAGDIASFNDVSTSDALEKLRSGLAGEIEPLRTVGVFLTENAVKERAYADGIAKRGETLSEGQKILARYQEILAQTDKQQGDAARTSDSFANQSRQLSANLADLATNVGTILLPPLNTALHLFNDLAKSILSLTNQFGPLDSAQQSVTTSTSRAGEAARTSAGQHDQSAASMKAEAAQAKALTDANEASATAILKGIASTTDYARAQAGVGAAVEAYTKAITGAGSATELANQKAEFATQHAKDLREAQEKLADSTQRVKDAQTAQADAAQAVIDRQKDVADATLDRDAAQAKLTAAQGVALDQDKKYADAVKDLASRQRALHDAEAALVDLEQEHQDAIRDSTAAAADYADAVAHLAAVQHGYAASSKEATDAARDLRQAQLDAESAQLDLADAQARLAELQAGTTASTVDAAQAARDLADAQTAVHEASLGLLDTQDKLAAAETRAAVLGGQNAAANREVLRQKLAVEAAQNRVNDATAAAGKVTTPEAANARDLERAKLAVEQATLRAADAQAKLNEASAKQEEILHGAAAGSKTLADAQDEVAEADRKRQEAAQKVLGFEGEFGRLADAAFKVSEDRAAIDDARVKIAEAEVEHYKELGDLKTKLLDADDRIHKAEVAAQKANEAAIKSSEGIAKAKREEGDAAKDLQATEKKTFENRKNSGTDPSDQVEALNDVQDAVSKAALAEVERRKQMAAVRGETISNVEQLKIFNDELDRLGAANKDKPVVLEAIAKIRGEIAGMRQDAQEPIDTAALDSFIAKLQGGVAAVGQAAEDADKGPGVFSRIGDAIDALNRKFPQIGDAVRSLRTVFTTGLDLIETTWDKFGKTITKIIGDVFGGIGSFIEGALRQVEGVIEIFSGILTGDWGKIWDGLKDIVGGSLDQIKAVFGTIFNVLGDVVVNGLPALYHIAHDLIFGIAEGLVNNFPTILDFFAGLPGKAVEAVGDATSFLVDTGGKLVSGLLAGIEAAAPAVWEFAKGIPGRVLEFVGDLGKTLLGAGGALLNGLFNGAKAVFGDVGKWFGDRGKDILAAVGDLGSTLLGAGKALVGGFLSGVKNVWGDVESFFGGLGSKLAGFGSALGNSFILSMQTVINGGIGVINKIIDFLNNISFTLPKVHVKGTGIDIGGQTIGLGPDIPRIPIIGAGGNLGDNVKEIARGIGGGFKALEKGGTALANRMHLVGERGPELFVPHEDGFVMNAQDTERLLAHLDSVNTPADIGWEGSDEALDRLTEAILKMQQPQISVPDPSWAQHVAHMVGRENARVFERLRR